MAIVSKEYLKRWVRIDFDDEDEDLDLLLQDAEESIISWTGRTYDELLGINGGFFPKPLRRAIVLLASHWYNQREAVSTAQMNEVPYSIQSLVKRFVKISEDESGTVTIQT